MKNIAFELDQSSFSDRVYNAILEMLVNHHIKPGEKLSEEDIATLLQVSRTPVREALRAGFGPGDCAAHRLAGTDCQSPCAARDACPEGVSSRYGEEEIAYHHRHSLRMARIYAERSSPMEAFRPAGGCGPSRPTGS